MSVSYFKDKASKIINWLSRRGIIATTAYDGLVNYFRSRSSLSSGTLEDDINDVCSVGTDAYNGSVQGDMILATGIGHPADAERAFWNSDNVDFGNIPKSISGLQAWYKADSSVYSDGAVQLTANDKEFLSIASNSTLQTGDIDWSIAGWFYLDSTGTKRTIVSKAATTPNREYALSVTAGNVLELIVYNGTGSGTIATVTHGTALSSATWYFVVAYHDSVNNVAGISLNGAAATTVATSGAGGTSTATFAVGANPDVTGLQYWNGRIDSLLWYKKVLSTDEITWLYNSGSGRMISDLYASIALSGITTSLISGWGFNETVGVRYDYVGTNHLAETFQNIIDASTLNGGFETLGGGGADVFGTWAESVSGTSTISDNSATPYAGSHSLQLNIDASGSLAYVYQTVGTVGKLYNLSLYAKSISGSPTVRVGDGVQTILSSAVTASWAQYSSVYRAQGTTFNPNCTTASSAVSVDNIVLTCAEIQGAAGIAKGVARDQNFASYFNASGDNLSAAHASIGTFTDTDDFHVVGWFKPDSFTQVGDLTVFTKAGDFRLLCIARSAGTASTTLYWEIRNSTYFVNIGTIVPGDWYFFSCSYNATTDIATFKINNTTSGTVSAPGANSGTSAFVIGTNFGASTAGTIDGVGLWRGRELTAAEQTYLFNAGKGRKYAEIGLAGTDGSNLLTNMVDYWNLDQESGVAAVGSYAGISATNTGVTKVEGVNYQEGIVSRWLDLSGNGYYYSQATNSKKPGYRTSSVNGRPALFFDGVDDVMAQTGGLGTFNAASGGTLIVVSKAVTNHTTYESVLEYLTGSVGTRISLFGGNTSGKYGVGGRRLDADAFAAIASTAALDTSNFVIQTGHVDWANSNIYQYLNGTLDGSSTSFQTDGTVSGTNSSAIFIGGSSSVPAFPGDNAIAEIIVYNRFLTNAELNTIHRYLGSRYGVTVATI